MAIVVGCPRPCGVVGVMREFIASEISSVCTTRDIDFIVYLLGAPRPMFALDEFATYFIGFIQSLVVQDFGD